MSKYGINVPKGVAAASIDEVRKAIQDVFPNESEVIVKTIFFPLFVSFIFFIF